MYIGFTHTHTVPTQQAFSDAGGGGEGSWPLLHLLCSASNSTPSRWKWWRSQPLLWSQWLSYCEHPHIRFNIWYTYLTQWSNIIQATSCSLLHPYSSCFPLPIQSINSSVVPNLDCASKHTNDRATTVLTAEQRAYSLVPSQPLLLK